MESLKKTQALQRLLYRASKYRGAIILSITVVIMMMADQIILVWMGEEYVFLTFDTRIFMSYWLIAPAPGIVATVLLAKEKVRPLLLLALGRSFVNLVLSLILVQYYGLTGVILGTVIPLYVLYPVTIIYGFRLMKDISLKEFAWKVWARIYPLAGLTALFLLLLRRLYLPTSLIEVGAVCFIGVLFYWGIFYFIGLETNEKDQLKKYIHL